jgi:hypothetical protein
MCPKGILNQKCAVYSGWPVMSITPRATWPPLASMNMSTPHNALPSHLRGYLKSDCLLCHMCIFLCTCFYNQGFLKNPLKFTVFSWWNRKKNIKTELQGTYFYSQTPSSSLANVYCEGSNVQDKFASQRKTKSTYALELLGLQRFIPKHLHQ